MPKTEAIGCVTVVASRTLMDANGRVAIAFEDEKGVEVGIFLSQAVIDQIRKDLALCETMLARGTGSA